MPHHDAQRLDLVAGQATFACLMALPLALLHARAVAEIIIAAIDIVFLLHTAVTRDAAWLRRPFTWAAAAWWLSLSLSSLLGSGGLLLGVLAIRLPLFSIAVGEWLLAGTASERRRHLLGLVLGAAFLWIGVQCWEQYLTGTNLFGQQRWSDGALTGPFGKPRAGPAFILLFFPVVLPFVQALAASQHRASRAAGGLACVMGVVTLLLIGQRMPCLLLLLGLAISALLLRQWRRSALLAVASGLALLAALPWISPATNEKLVVHFADQLRHFSQSAYGLIFVRGYAVAEQHPWRGLGFDGFRRGCADFWNMHGIDWLGIPTAQLNGGMEGCNLHPHNYYLEAADNAGLPGLALFTLMAAAALARLGGGLWRNPDAQRTGLFVAILLALWPIATTSAFTSMPNGGWVFLLIGAGMAQSGGGAQSGARAVRGARSRGARSRGARSPGGRRHEAEGNVGPALSFEPAADKAGPPMSEDTTIDHGFIRAWTEARDGRPAMLDPHTAPGTRLRLDFGAPEPDLTEIAWDEFFTLFDAEGLGFAYDSSPGQLSRTYRLVPRDAS